MALKVSSVYAKAPASSANLKAGWDILAVAVVGLSQELYNHVDLTFVPDKPGHVEVLPDTGRYGDRVPIDPERNLAANVVRAMLNKYDPNWVTSYGVRVQTRTDIPFPAGLGSSGAINAAAAQAVAGFLQHEYDNNLPSREQAYWAIMGEKLAAGTPHPDNGSASTMGGMSRSRFSSPYSLDDLFIEKIEVPDWVVVFGKPHDIEKTSTEELRKMLRGKTIPVQEIPNYQARHSQLVEAVRNKDIDAVAAALDYDDSIEKARAESRSNGKLFLPARTVFGYGEHITYDLIRQNDKEMREQHIATWMSGAGPFRAALCDPERYSGSVETARQGLLAHFARAGYKDTELIEAQLTNLGSIDIGAQIVLSPTNGPSNDPVPPESVPIGASETCGTQS